MALCSYHGTYSAGECIHCVLSKIKARTQKGKGLAILNSLYYMQALDLTYILQVPEHVDVLGDTGYPYFARPAPAEPKHGYIDSRLVKTPTECKALLKQVLADDPGGELILCKFLEHPQYNLVWTPTSLTIGKGHDGATAGKNTVCVPLAGAIEENLSFVLEKAGIGPDQHPYIEAVQQKDTSYAILTQLRAGPAVPIGDYIPNEVIVKKVIKADPEKYKDREWEIEMEGLKGTEGLVVWHPNGSMTSHFAIHAFANKIPILFGGKPKVGAILKPTSNAKAAFDPQAMLAGVVAGSRLPLKYNTNTAAAVNTLLLGAHNATVMTKGHSKWVGMAAALMLRLGSTALVGEARHLRNRSWPEGKPGRSDIYAKVLNDSLHKHRSRASRLVNVFRYGNWDGSFGGMKWAYCGVATVALFQAVKNLAKTPTEETTAEVVKTLNIAVNQAHNGGWWLNKFTSGGAFEQIQQGYLLEIVRCADTLYKLERISRTIKQGYLDQQVAKMAKWPETTLRPPRVRSAKLTYLPGVTSFSIELFTRLLGKGSRTITTKFPDDMSANMSKLLVDNTYLLRTSEGYAVEVRDAAKSVIVWEDEPITMGL